jgi:hypothetical protein
LESKKLTLENEKIKNYCISHTNTKIIGRQTQNAKFLTLFDKILRFFVRKRELAEEE